MHDHLRPGNNPTSRASLWLYSQEVFVHVSKGVKFVLRVRCVPVRRHLTMQDRARYPHWEFGASSH